MITLIIIILFKAGIADREQMEMPFFVHVVENACPSLGHGYMPKTIYDISRES